MAAATSQDDLLNTVASHLRAIVPCDRGAIGLRSVTGESRELVLFGPLQLIDGGSEPATAGTVDPLVLNEAVRRRRRLRGRAGLALSQEDTDRFVQLPLRQTHSTPVRDGRRQLATLELARQTDDPFDSEDVALLTRLADLLGLAMGRLLSRGEAAAARESSTEDARRLGILSEIGGELASIVTQDEVYTIVDRAARAIIPNHRLSYAEVDTEEGMFHVTQMSGSGRGFPVDQAVPLDDTIVHLTLEDGQPVYSPDLRMLSNPDAEMLAEAGVVSALTLPVLAGDSALGVLTVTAEKPDALSMADRELLGSIARLMGSALDRVRNAERVSYTQRHDDLTGLPNRQEIVRQIGGHASLVVRGRATGSVLVLDLDHFKAINDSFGHDVGDAYLVDLVGRVRGVLGDEGVLARIGGDQFAALLPGADAAAAAETAEQVRAHVEGTVFRWEGRRLPVTVSIGAAAIDSAGGYAALRGAEAACSRAKRDGRNRVVVGQPHGADGRFDADGDWVARIVDALESDRFELFAQPIQPLGSPRSRSAPMEPIFELLVRMVDGDGDFITPGRFMRVAEDYGLMSRIDNWVIRQGLAWMAGPDAPATGLCSINVSAHSLESASFLDDVLALLENASVEPERLLFEITETAATRNVDRAVQFITTLKSLGCRFVMDDFGNGFGSVAALKRLPVDAIKIDGQLVRDIHSDPVDLAAVCAVKTLADAMGMWTMAELVESEEALIRLREIGVDYAQGYHVGRPQPLAFLSNLQAL